MKLRVSGNSIRLRVRRSEVAKLVQSGRLEETVYLGTGEDASLTYALESRVDADATEVRYLEREIRVTVPAACVLKWAEGTDVGIYDTLTGPPHALDVVVEKDFACLDQSDADNVDTFPNPLTGTVC